MFFFAVAWHTQKRVQVEEAWVPCQGIVQVHDDLTSLIASVLPHAREASFKSHFVRVSTAGSCVDFYLFFAESSCHS